MLDRACHARHVRIQLSKHVACLDQQALTGGNDSTALRHSPVGNLDAIICFKPTNPTGLLGTEHQLEWNLLSVCIQLTLS